MSRAPWWKGRRGEGYLVGQGLLLLLVAIGPRTWPGLPVWSPVAGLVGSIAGAILLLAGALMALAGSLWLGRNLTPLPHPKDDATLVQSGPYRLVRHPIYSGLVLAALGWGLWIQGWLTLGYAVALLVFLDIKARREEVWLRAKYPEYAAYQRRVRKLIPFV